MPASRKRPNWPQPLRRPLTIPGIMKLKTLGDVRKLLGHIPKARAGSYQRGGTSRGN
jgi:hypothetical protein